MAQFRRARRNGRVVLASTAFLALSLVGYGNAATAGMPAPLALGAEPAVDQAAPAIDGSALAKVGGGIATGEDSRKPPATGQTGKVVDHCKVGAPTRVPPQTTLKPTKVGGGPVATPQTDPAMSGSAPNLSTKVVVHVAEARPGAIAVPELREGTNGVKGFASPGSGGCSVPEPMPGVPLKKPPMGRPAPVTGGGTVVTTCIDSPPDLPRGGAGVSPAKPDAGPVAEPGGRAEDQVAGAPSAICVQPDGDQPVSSSDEVPPTGPSSDASDAVSAQEAGSPESTR